MKINDLVFKTRGEAEAVIAEAKLIIGVDGYVLVGDIYSLCDIMPRYLDHHHGWSSVDDFQIVEENGVYVMKFPETKHSLDLFREAQG